VLVVVRNEKLTVGADESGARLDRVLAAQLPDVSRSRHKALILAGQVAVDGTTIRDPSYRVNAGSRIKLNLPPPAETTIAAEDIPLKIVFEDAELLVLDKPAGLVVHPAAGKRSGTLVNALIAHCGASLSGIGG
jgi:23S rRNA pseudouridine1911/1915/1917 synthase